MLVSLSKRGGGFQARGRGPGTPFTYDPLYRHSQCGVSQSEQIMLKFSRKKNPTGLVALNAARNLLGGCNHFAPR